MHKQLEATIFIGVWCGWIMAVTHITDHYWQLNQNQALQQELQLEIKELERKGDIHETYLTRQILKQVKKKSARTDLVRDQWCFHKLVRSLLRNLCRVTAAHRDAAREPKSRASAGTQTPSRYSATTHRCSRNGIFC